MSKPYASKNQTLNTILFHNQKAWAWKAFRSGIEDKSESSQTFGNNFGNLPNLKFQNSSSACRSKIRVGRKHYMAYEERLPHIDFDQDSLPRRTTLAANWSNTNPTRPNWFQLNWFLLTFSTNCPYYICSNRMMNQSSFNFSLWEPPTFGQIFEVSSATGCWAWWLKPSGPVCPSVPSIC